MSVILSVAAGILVCLCLSAFCSSAEMAYSSCNAVRLENMRDDGVKRAGAAVKIIERFDDALSAILIGNNLANIAASSLASVLVILLLGSDEYAWAATVVLTLLVIIFGETIPKITAKKAANTLSLRYAYAVRVMMIVLKPLILLIVGLVHLLTGREAPEEETDGEEAVEAAPFSRLPVYEGTIDNVVGVLYLNHFLKALTEDGGRTDIRRLLMPTCYVYKTMKLPAVLSLLRRAKQHLAVVTDEYGGTLGVISMEDVLEQIVGDIWDDTDVIEQEVVERAEGEYELDGDMSIYDFLDLAGIPEEDFEAESSTLGGWTLERFGAFPKKGDSFRYASITVTVLKMDGRRVEKLLVKAEPAKKEET